MRDDVEQQATSIVGLIHGHRIDMVHEKTAQAQIEQILRDAGLAHEREPRLSPRDIPDFLMDGTCLAIEVKIQGARKAAVYRQLCRYAEHAAVHGLLLVTSLAMGLPAEINGKPSFYASLGRGWI